MPIWFISYVVKGGTGRNMFYVHVTTDTHPLIYVKQYYEKLKIALVLTSYRELSEAEIKLLREHQALQGYAPDEIDLTKGFNSEIVIPIG